MTDWNAVSAFMGQVVAWPGFDDPGFVNLHYSMESSRAPKGAPMTGKLIKGMGWPFRDLGAFISRAAWINDQINFKDVWYCLSRQSAMAKNTRGKDKAFRRTENATHLKAIWIDMDVKPDAYLTIEDALKAAMWFREKVGLPPFSAIVGSGGGIHVYWISNVALTQAEWRPYASGLKALLLAEGIRCDAGITTDAARILRVPGTFNHKTNPPKPVQLFNVPLVAYNFEAELSFLTKIAPVHKATPAPGGPTAHNIFADGADIKSFESGPAFKVDGPGLQAGIERFKNDKLLDFRPIVEQCGFYREQFRTRGVGTNQALWMHAVTGTTFMENGNAIAHEISSKHKDYSTDDTDKMYDRKVAERNSLGLGYPSCATFKDNGSKSCATCPLFAKGKSPLNIRPKVTATVSPGAAPAAGAPPILSVLGDCMPAGFQMNEHHHICKVVEDEDKDGNLSTTLVPLFQCVLSNLWLQKEPGEHLNVTASVDKGHFEETSVSLGEISKPGFRGYLGQCRILIDTRGAKFLEEFFLSIIGRLRALAAAQVSVPFGWYEEGGAVRGFSFASKVYLDDGTERACSAADPVIRKVYTPTGDINEWFKAAKTVTDRKRPELTTTMLMAFASPLIALNGKSTAVLAAYGTDSGAGKTSAYRVGMSVWGHPVGSKITERQTANSITGVMKLIRHLPFYWDEITQDTHRKKFKDVMHELDGGKEKGRMIDGTRHQDIGYFAMMIHYASNQSLLGFLRQDNLNTWASQMRVLEWEVKKIDHGPGHMKNADAEAMLDLCNRNFGRMGQLYAKFLGTNHIAIKEEFRLKCNAVEEELQGGNSERYWYTSVAVMTLAAKYARQMGLDVDPDEIEAFMRKVYMANMENRAEFQSGGKIDNAETVLSRYLKERDAQQRVVWTNYMHNQRGRAPKPVVILKGLGNERNHSGGIEVRFAVENQLCVIAREDFVAFVKEKKHSDTQIIKALKEMYGAQQQKLEICSGWLKAVREDCIVLKVGPLTGLWDFMTSHSTPDEKAKMEAGEEVPPETADTTGLTPTDNVVAFVKGAVRG